MKIKSKIAVVAGAGALTVGGAMAFVGGASATSDPIGAAAGTGPGTGARATFVCAHLSEIEAHQSLRGQLLAGRLTLLQEARQSATRPRSQARIDTAITRTQSAETKLTANEAKLKAFASTHCGAAATTTPTTTA
jgi:hypothetical protein